jgi:hypothetical protein
LRNQRADSIEMGVIVLEHNLVHANPNLIQSMWA